MNGSHRHRIVSSDLSARASVEALEARRLMAVTVPDTYQSVGWMDIDSKSNTYHNFVPSLTVGVDYFLVASGMAKIGRRSDRMGDRYTDAMYFDDYNETEGFHRSTFTGRFAFQGVTDADGGGFAWGDYQPNHIYGQRVTAAAGTLQVKFEDAKNKYGDNDGSMTLEVYRKVTLDSLTVADHAHSARTITDTGGYFRLEAALVDEPAIGHDLNGDGDFADIGVPMWGWVFQQNATGNQLDENLSDY